LHASGLVKWATASRYTHGIPMNCLALDLAFTRCSRLSGNTPLYPHRRVMVIDVRQLATV
jgi:hypothetical protein